MRSRLGAQLPQKVKILLGLSLGICAPYFSLQILRPRPAWSPPATALDRWIAFDPGWVWAYLSIALLVPLGPLLATRRSQLVRYARGLAALCATAFAVFLLLPVAGPRPDAPPDHALYRLLVRWDRPTNSMPSLHAGLTVYTLLFAHRVAGAGLAVAARAAFLLGACAWGGLILYGTLATRQHWAVDIPPAMLMAWLAHRWAWRRDPDGPGAGTPPARPGPPRRR